MNLKHKLLDHPFYQAWEKGEITKEQLSSYAASYNEFIKMIPEFWSAVISTFDSKSEEGKKIIGDETAHVNLWKKWSDTLPGSENFPSMDSEINAFAGMNPSELLGAIHAFEIQQPDVARTKKEGLMKHYGFNESDLIYFDEHMNEAEHIGYGDMLAKNFTDRNEFEKGFEKGSQIIYNSLDKFIN
ncbi:MAG: hypothetical protein HY959_10610 [Ignavibacteriae bacterium]|nr:hypothetical protein [Ignavibacteriota bacterium]